MLAVPGRVAILPSLMDNSPYTVMECLVTAIPFLASKVGGVTELIHPEDADRVLVELTSKALSLKIIEVIMDYGSLYVTLSSLRAMLHFQIDS